MATFTAPDGVTLHYEIEGHGPSLLLHLGAGCDSDLWRAAGYQMQETASLMPHATRVRLVGQGHINAFLRSDLALPHVLEFLARPVGA